LVLPSLEREERSRRARKLRAGAGQQPAMSGAVRRAIIAQYAAGTWAELKPLAPPQPADSDSLWVARC